MRQSLYEMHVLVNKRAINEYSKAEGMNPTGYDSIKTYVEGRSGSEFELKLTNNSNESVLMIPSVDGLSVIDGKPADSNSKGYIVGAHDNIIIPGWTLTDQAVAKFIFADKKKSYAANHIDTPSEANVGVIGLLVWSMKTNKDYNKLLEEIEKIKDKQDKTPWIQPWVYPYPVYPQRRYDDWGWWKPYPMYTITCSTNPSGVGISDSSLSGVGTSNETKTFNMPTDSILRASSMNCSSPTANVATPQAMTLSADNNSSLSEATLNVTEDMYALGTGFGKETEFKTVEQTFEKDAIVATIALYYDTRKNLEKMGIIISKTKKEKQEPNPFPGLTGCKPPKNWKA